MKRSASFPLPVSHTRMPLNWSRPIAAAWLWFAWICGVGTGVALTVLRSAL